jgi:hypothetical protein
MDHGAEIYEESTPKGRDLSKRREGGRERDRVRGGEGDNECERAMGDIAAVLYV